MKNKTVALAMLIGWLSVAPSGPWWTPWAIGVFVLWSFLADSMAEDKRRADAGLLRTLAMGVLAAGVDRPAPSPIDDLPIRRAQNGAEC